MTQEGVSFVLRGRLTCTGHPNRCTLVDRVIFLANRGNCAEEKLAGGIESQKDFSVFLALGRDASPTKQLQNICCVLQR